jgi:hypothetical protein
VKLANGVPSLPKLESSLIKLVVRIACFLVLVSLTGCASHTRSMAESTYLLPMLGINMGLDALDHMDASHVSRACGGFATPAENILEKVVLGAGFSLFTGNVKLGIN